MRAIYTLKNAAVSGRPVISAKFQIPNVPHSRNPASLDSLWCAHKHFFDVHVKKTRVLNHVRPDIQRVAHNSGVTEQQMLTCTTRRRCDPVKLSEMRPTVFPCGGDVGLFVHGAHPHPQAVASPHSTTPVIRWWFVCCRGRGHCWRSCVIQNEPKSVPEITYKSGIVWSRKTAGGMMGGGGVLMHDTITISSE